VDVRRKGLRGKTNPKHKEKQLGATSSRKEPAKNGEREGTSEKRGTKSAEREKKVTNGMDVGRKAY